jgi:Cysteine-rich CPCC
MLIATLPDGRQLFAEREDPAGDWTVHFATAEDRTVTGRWLLKVLTELLELAPGTKPQWVLDLVRQLAGHETSVGWRYACPCCDFLTLTEPPTGTFAICPVCRWEDDNIQFENIDYEGGANGVSLRQARKNFRQYAASDLRSLDRTRAPRPEELP